MELRLLYHDDHWRSSSHSHWHRLYRSPLRRHSRRCSSLLSSCSYPWFRPHVHSRLCSSFPSFLLLRPHFLCCDGIGQLVARADCDERQADRSTLPHLPRHPPAQIPTVAQAAAQTTSSTPHAISSPPHSFLLHHPFLHHHPFLLLLPSHSLAPHSFFLHSPLPLLWADHAHEGHSHLLCQPPQPASPSTPAATSTASSSPLRLRSLQLYSLAWQRGAE